MRKVRQRDPNEDERQEEAENLAFPFNKDFFSPLWAVTKQSLQFWPYILSLKLIDRVFVVIVVCSFLAKKGKQQGKVTLLGLVLVLLLFGLGRTSALVLNQWTHL